MDSDVLRTWYAECDRNLFSHCGHLYLIHRMRSELLVALSAVVPFLPGVQGDVRLQVGFLREALATEGAQEGFLHLHVLVHLEDGQVITSITARYGAVSPYGSLKPTQ